MKYKLLFILLTMAATSLLGACDQGSPSSKSTNMKTINTVIPPVTIVAPKIQTMVPIDAAIPTPAPPTVAPKVFGIGKVSRTPIPTLAPMQVEGASIFCQGALVPVMVLDTTGKHLECWDAD